MDQLVSVICVSYNHEKFVRAAIQSVLDQSYKNIELIVVDDGSTDNSVAVIRSMNVTLIDVKKNQGYTKAFNAGWRMCKGDFIIDLAGDDELMPDRVKSGVEEFQKHDETYGVQFGDAIYMTEDSVASNKHSRRFPNPPQGDIFKALIRRYFICSPTMMSRRKVMEKLNGYDEDLAYEDFDFWIRSSREFRYFYTPEVLVKKRIVRGSLSERQFRKGSPQQMSTYKVCDKIKALIRTPEEKKALEERLWYEIRQCVFRMDFSLARKYFALLSSLRI